MHHHRLVPCHPKFVLLLDGEAIASAEVNANLEGWQHLVDGQTEVAIEDFTRAIALGQDLPVAYNNRGIAHEVLEQMVEAQADYSEADRLAETDSELQQRLQSVRVRKPISWKGRKEPAAATEAEGTDFLISFCNLDHKESNRRLRQLEEGVFFQGKRRCWTENLRDFIARMRILNEILHVFSRFFPLIAENLPPSVFDLLLVEGSFLGGLRARCASPLAVPLH